MSLPRSVEIRKEDVPGAPDWIDGLLSQINGFFRDTYTILNKGITFGDNIKAQIHHGKVRSGDLPIRIKKTSASKVLGVVKLYCERDTDEVVTLTDAIDVQWRDDGDSVKIFEITNITSDLWRYGIIILYQG